jgi:hypothetical protein
VLRAYLQGRDASTVGAAMAAGASDIAQLTPEVRDRIPDLPAPLALEPEQARFRLFDSFATFLKNAAAAEPLVLVLDDLHLADRPSLLLLQFVAAEVARTRMLVLATYRHTEVGRHHPLSDTLSELGRNPQTERLFLRGLPETDVARLIQLIAGELPTGALISAVSRHTEGNPFFIGELVPLLLAEPGLQAGDPTSFGLAVPQGVREVIGRRLNRLSVDCNRVLALASIIGREFEATVLERLSDLSLDRVVSLIEEGTEAHLVVEVPRAVGRYAFAHALIRETLYEEVPSLRRVQLHRRVGEALEALHAGRIDAHLPELAHHFFAAAPAGEVERAIAYARRAGARAVEQLAFEDAAGHYRRALHSLDLLGSADDGARCDLLLALGDAQTGAGEGAAARETFLRAADLARGLEAPERLARAALGVGTGFQGFWGYGAGLIDEPLVGLLEESLAALGSEDSALRALVLGRLAVALYWSPLGARRAAISRLGADAVAVAERVGDPAVLLLALASRHWADWTPDNIQDRLAVASRIVGLADRIGNREMSLLGHAFHLAAELDRGHLHQANAHIESFARLAEETRQPRYLWWATMFRAMRWGEATRHFDDAREMNTRIGARPAVARTLHDQAAMLLARGRSEDRASALPLLVEARAIASALGMTRLVASIDRLEMPGERPATGPAPPRPAVFRKEGEFWTLAWDGTVCRLKDSRGLHYLAVLLRHPGEEFHARDLVATAGAGEPGPRETGSAGPVIDVQARAEYRRRLADLRDELEEAERFNDTGRAERARAEIEFLSHELSAAVGLGNRSREVASPAERARLAVTKRIRDVLARLRTEHPALGQYLEATIRTGQFCSYDPPAGNRPAWTF